MRAVEKGLGGDEALGEQVAERRGSLGALGVVVATKSCPSTPIPLPGHGISREPARPRAARYSRAVARLIHSR